MQKIKLLDNTTGQKENGEVVEVFARYSTELKQGLNEGYYFEGSGKYLPDNKQGNELKDLWILKAGYSDNQSAYEDDFFYYSEWYLIEDELETCYDNEGKEYEIIK